MRHAAALSLLLASACTTMNPEPPAQAERMVAPILTTPDALDSSTYAQPQVARVTHVALDLGLDFERKSIGGTATLDILARPDASQIVLDSDGLQVSRVTDARGNELPFTIGKHDPEKGAPLTITIGNARQITVAYTANPQADALQWLAPEQTAGGKQPFLFSQGQAILNRSWIPTQDSPGIRQTWEAWISSEVPATGEVDVVMSGLRGDKPDPTPPPPNRVSHYFYMDKPVAPYLIAIAAGDIDFAKIGPRTGVWAEPSVLPRARAETADTEKMVEAAERLYGPYRWGRYDMIVLPPAFPYGGMENPTLTFLTPTFIAGDRSLTGLVAHELAHSWSGNLVTNANWTDSWLNEGVTSYFENRIVEEIYGTKRAQQEVALDYAAIVEKLDEVGRDAPGTALHQPEGVENAGSEIVYNKGAAFLRTLEHEVGRERFDAWLRQWFDNHAFEPATSNMIYEDLRTNLARDGAEAERLRLREWIYEPGLPTNVAKPNPAAFAEVDASASAYIATGALPNRQEWQRWTSAERQRFLQEVPAERSPRQLETLDSRLGLSTSGNNEELFLWLDLALANRYEPAVPQAERFLRTVGRAKFVRPLFTTLMGEDEWGQAIARRIYAEARPTYHSVTRDAVDKLVPR